MPGTVDTSKLWLRRFHPAPDAPARLLCFPHAGGGANFYFPVSRALSPGTDVLAVQYPGRQDRMSESPLTDIHALADHVTEAVIPWTDRPLVLFGHSMGSLVAFEVARRLQDRGVRPRALFVSARRPPHLHREPADGDLSQDALVRAMKELNGTDSSLLDDPTILDMIMPSLRGDFQAVRDYRYRPSPRLACPLVALSGDSDPWMDAGEIHGWRDHTSAEFRSKVLPGDHFYLVQHPETVLSLITEWLSPPHGIR
ncbi:thioesterase II family protein [Nocardiopsis halotolerans]|uniref:thioesterase II family protein n=1 Tax=Nocardiopsis halotolerans TaxID=124252 RepID=UPI00034508B9|nr:alpha/beta fold hydrolase [Nocardiopsis halotolerans]